MFYLKSLDHFFDFGENFANTLEKKVLIFFNLGLYFLKINCIFNFFAQLSFQDKKKIFEQFGETRACSCRQDLHFKISFVQI